MLPPPNSKTCQKKGCHASAVGFVAFETNARQNQSGFKSILPFEWRCEEHARTPVLALDIPIEKRKQIYAAFERRLGFRPGPLEIQVGVSTLTEQEVEELLRGSEDVTLGVGLVHVDVTKDVLIDYKH